MITLYRRLIAKIAKQKNWFIKCPWTPQDLNISRVPLKQKKKDLRKSHLDNRSGNILPTMATC